MVSFLQDFHYAVRILTKNKSFTIVALLTLTVGIGVNTAIFSVVNAVLLEPLPYADSKKLAIIWTAFPTAGVLRAPASGPELDELQKRSKLFEGIAGIWVGNLAFVGENEPEQIKQGQVTANFFPVLGVHPAMGRDFSPEEEGKSTNPVVLLSDVLWRRRYGTDPQIVGKSIRTARGPIARTESRGEYRSACRPIATSPIATGGAARASRTWATRPTARRSRRSSTRGRARVGRGRGRRRVAGPKRPHTAGGRRGQPIGCPAHADLDRPPANSTPRPATTATMPTIGLKTIVCGFW